MRPWPFDEPYPARIGWPTSDITLSAGVSLIATEFDALKIHPVLVTAVSKLRWGHRNLVALEANVEEVLSDPNYQAGLTADRDGDTGDHVFRVSSVPDLTDFADDVVNSVFDVAGNYRAALDKMAWKIVLSAHGGSAPDPAGVKFPIAGSAQEWIKAGRARNQFDPAHCGFVEAFQPYHGVNGLADSWHGTYVHPLAMLQSLSNEGKHWDDWPVTLPGANAFISRQAMPDDFDEYLALAMSFQPVMMGGGGPMEVGNEVVRLRLHPGAAQHIDDAGRLIPVIAFSEGRHVVETLKRC